MLFYQTLQVKILNLLKNVSVHIINFQSTFKKQVCFLDTLRQEFLNLFSYLNHYTYDKLQTTR